MQSIQTRRWTGDPVSEPVDNGDKPNCCSTSLLGIEWYGEFTDGEYGLGIDLSGDGCKRPKYTSLGVTGLSWYTN